MHGIRTERVNKLFEGSPNIVDLLQSGEIDLIINTITKGKTPAREGFQIRRRAAERGIPCLTSLDTATALYEALRKIQLQATPLL